MKPPPSRLFNVAGVVVIATSFALLVYIYLEATR
jgi:hypothetical protein